MLDVIAVMMNAIYVTSGKSEQAGSGVHTRHNERRRRRPTGSDVIEWCRSSSRHTPTSDFAGDDALAFRQRYEQRRQRERTELWRGYWSDN